uniref:Baculoviral IAP repeat-containing protein 6 n=1 Tax=Macrostomum lignano TaxID=282301 RepID=A0A1I8JEL6_9PLAT
ASSTVVTDFFHGTGQFVLSWGNRFSIRRDLNGTLLLDSLLDCQCSDKDEIVNLDLTVTDATHLHALLNEFCDLDSGDQTDQIAADELRDAYNQLGDGLSRVGQRSGDKHARLVLSGQLDGLLQRLSTLQDYLVQSQLLNNPGVPVLASLIDRLVQLRPDPPINPLELARTADKSVFNSEANRRETFATWPHMHYKWALPEAMAAAGFYHSPPDSDRALCFACIVCLVSWEPTDEPWSEHERHSPNCVFVKNEFTNNVPLIATQATEPARITQRPVDIIGVSNSPMILPTSSLDGDLSLWDLSLRYRVRAETSIKRENDLFTSSSESNRSVKVNALLLCDANVDRLAVLVACQLANQPDANWEPALLVYRIDRSEVSYLDSSSHRRSRRLPAIADCALLKPRQLLLLAPDPMDDSAPAVSVAVVEPVAKRTRCDLGDASVAAELGCAAVLTCDSTILVVDLDRELVTYRVAPPPHPASPSGDVNAVSQSESLESSAVSTTGSYYTRIEYCCGLDKLVAARDRELHIFNVSRPDPECLETMRPAGSVSADAALSTSATQGMVASEELELDGSSRPGANVDSSSSVAAGAGGVPSSLLGSGAAGEAAATVGGGSASSSSSLFRQPLIDSYAKLLELTQYEYMTPRFMATVGPCWTELQPEQQQRLHPMYQLGTGSVGVGGISGIGADCSRSFKLTPDSASWSEHLIDIVLLKSVCVGHIDLKLTIDYFQQPPPNIAVTLLTLNVSGSSVGSKDPDSISLPYIDDDSSLPLSSDQLKALNAEVIAGPYNLAEYLDGSVQLLADGSLTPGREPVPSLLALLNWILSILYHCPGSDTRLPELIGEQADNLVWRLLLQNQRTVANLALRLFNSAVALRRSACAPGLARAVSRHVTRLAEVRSPAGLANFFALANSLHLAGYTCDRLEERLAKLLVELSVSLRDRSGEFYPSVLRSQACLYHNPLEPELFDLDPVVAYRLRASLRAGPVGNSGSAAAAAAAAAAGSNTEASGGGAGMPGAFAGVGSAGAGMFNPYAGSAASGGGAMASMGPMTAASTAPPGAAGYSPPPYGWAGWAIVPLGFSSGGGAGLGLGSSAAGSAGAGANIASLSQSVPMLVPKVALPGEWASAAASGNCTSTLMAAAAAAAAAAATSGGQGGGSGRPGSDDDRVSDVLRLLPPPVTSTSEIQAWQTRGLIEVEPLHFTCCLATGGTRIEYLDTCQAYPMASAGSASASAAMASAAAASASGQTAAGVTAASSAGAAMPSSAAAAAASEKKSLEAKLMDPTPPTPKTTPATTTHTTPLFATPSVSPPPPDELDEEAGAAAAASGKAPSGGDIAEATAAAAAAAAAAASAAARLSSHSTAASHLLNPPQPLALVVDRMHPGARRFVILDFGHSVLLTDVLIPACSDLGSISVTVWNRSEEIDSLRLAVSTDIGSHPLVLTDLYPPPLCRFLKVAIIGKMAGSTPNRTRIPLGAFFGHSCLDATLESAQQLKAVAEENLCRYGMACAQLQRQLDSLANTPAAGVGGDSSGAAAAMPSSSGAASASGPSALYHQLPSLFGGPATAASPSLADPMLAGRLRQAYDNCCVLQRQVS